MTWGEIQTITLQKMFSHGGEDPPAQDLAEPYLPAMPHAANEGLALLATAGRFIQRRLSVAPDGEPAGNMLRCDLREAAPDFYALDPEQIYLSSPAGYTPADGAQTEGESILWLPAIPGGEYIVYYYAYPAPLSADTPDGQPLALPPEAETLLPLYMASQLYKDDDPALAMLYRQEFDAGLDYLRRAAPRLRAGGRTFRSVTGWW
ncbi:MAG: hypothetical protein FWG93_03125 [Oscillospiraceae bacterium]|nr:hypothetical protein [Oscillospiraceae bacterium]